MEQIYLILKYYLNEDGERAYINIGESHIHFNNYNELNKSRPCVPEYEISTLLTERRLIDSLINCLFYRT